MRKTIDDVLDRGNKLDDVADMSKSLAQDSKKYKWGAKKLSLMAWWKQYAPFTALGGVAVILLLAHYYW
jgi:vesicle transport protein SEC22